MKILAQAIPGNTYAGFSRAAEAAGHSWVWWEERHTPAFDAFDEIGPELLFYMDMTRAMQKCVDVDGVATVQGLMDDQFRFIVGDQGLQCNYLVDTHMFNKGEVHPALFCDIGIACAPNPLGLKLCNGFAINIKILYEQGWPTTQYLGAGSLSDKRDLYRSSNVVLVDDPLEAIRVIACGSIPVTSNKDMSTTLLKHGVLVPYYDDAHELYDFHDEIILANEHQGERLREDLQKTLKGHSYDDALTVIMENLQ